MTKIILNGVEVEADPKKPLIHACHTEGVDVPMYCYHPGLTPVGSCRICQVEVTQGKMPPRVVVACRTPVAEGMIVNTEAKGAHDARRECLEFLLKNHPLDCPICDKAGECDLQDFSFAEGQGEGRSVEPRRKLEKRKSLGDVIVLDEERCILCSRCVRFFEDVTKKPQLTVSEMGARSKISTFMDRPLEGNYQGNLADVCPVGALTLKKFRFQARVWNLSKHLSTCGECSRGCSISVEVLRRGEVKRIRPRYNPDVNEWWMCDTGRFSFDRYNAEGRIEGGAVRDARGLVATSAADALAAAAATLQVHASPVIVVSPWLTVEEGELVAQLGERLGVKPRFVSPEANELKDDLLHTGDPCPNRRGLTELGIEGVSAADLCAELADAESALLIGERMDELLGAEALAELPSALRLIAIAPHPVHSPATLACIGAPTCVERTGTWVNVDGHRGPLAAARPMPAGVSTLVDTIASLAGRVASASSPEAAV
ncbi:MAG: 2Fe-2S iron-sulfur cluster-binding protein [Planctomycetota bacterium]